MTKRIVRSPRHPIAIPAVRQSGKSTAVLTSTNGIAWPSVAGQTITHIRLHNDQGEPVGTSKPVILSGGGGGGGQVTFTGPAMTINGTPKTRFDETNVLEGGEVIVTHRLNDCDGYWCCIHNPSPHHMRGWIQTFNFPMKAIMRICACGDEHPDPDERGKFRHSCACGCCSPKGRVIQKRRKRVPV